MQSKVVNLDRMYFVEAPFIGENTSGLIPINDLVLVKTDMASLKTIGGLDLPDDVVERHQLSATSGVIAELGSEAFRWNADRTRPYEGDKPKPGDRVLFEKYAGQLVKGDDGSSYRLVADKAIGAIKREKK